MWKEECEDGRSWGKARLSVTPVSVAKTPATRRVYNTYNLNNNLLVVGAGSVLGAAVSVGYGSGSPKICDLQVLIN